MITRDWIASAAKRLNNTGCESAQLEATLIAAHLFSNSRAWMLAHLEESIDEASAELLLKRRLKHEPLAYVLEKQEFFGRTFRVKSGVLIPRPETEILVEVALKELPQNARVLDLGTGSGCIAISLALENPEYQITACDISQEALTIASENAKSLGAHIAIVQSDLFSALDGQQFHAVVTNPPYVETTAKLSPEIHEFEPKVALFAGEDGLDVYRRLAVEAKQYLVPGDQLITEIGAGQAASIQNIFAAENWKPGEQWNDLAGHTRVLQFWRVD